jgi:excisionase family DNA binding protein
MAATTTRNLVSLVDAAQLMGVHPRTVRRYISIGLIKGYRLGPRLLKVDSTELQRLLQQIPAAGA